MSNVNISTASFVSPYQVVLPNDKTIPLRNSLIDLTPDELAGAILSTYFIKEIMPPLVTVNTIIWQNWNEIFSRTPHNWNMLPHEEQQIRMEKAIKVLEGK